MQKTCRYLANNKVTIVANLAGYITEYRPVYQKHLKVYRGIDNLLYFEVKNHDQKPVSLAGFTPKLMIFDENNNMVIQKDGTVIDDAVTLTTNATESAADTTLSFASTSAVAVGQRVTGTYIKRTTLVSSVAGNIVTMNKSATNAVPAGTAITFQTDDKKGVFSVNITDNELLDLKQQYLKYAIYLADSTGAKTLTYSEAHFDAKATMYVDGDAFPGPMATTSITGFTSDSKSPTEWKTESVDAQPGINGNTALHTAVFYTSAFAGNMIVQGTLDNQVTLNSNWANVATVTFDGTETEPKPVNFNGVFSHLRFYTATDPTDKVTKILIRN
tara:strand:- start:4260 stop:5249 length:990 start_codon:yes stop_codon:yes gene_type:complete